jgi:hypothetical protein
MKLRTKRYEGKNMNKLTKGALTMVLVGSVTFSVTNALLADHSSKQSAEANASTISGDQKTADDTNHADKTVKDPTQKTADDTNQAEKTVKDQTPTPDVKEVQTTISHNNDAFQAVSYNGNESDKAIAAIQNNTTTSIAAAATTNTTVPATNTTVNSNPTTTGTTSTKSAATPAPTTSTSTTKTTTMTITTTKTTNHGKQVSQAAKEKATSHQNKKENSGKKKF